MKNLILLIISLIILSGCSNETVKPNVENWEESATLVREIVVSDDGQKGDFVFRIGDNGKFGFGEYGPFIAGESQKYMWHFWGEKEILTKSIKVIGVSRETGEEVTVINEPSANSLSPNTGADHHVPSKMSLPSSGLWKLKVYFGDDLFGNVVVNVKDK